MGGYGVVQLPYSVTQVLQEAAGQAGYNTMETNPRALQEGISVPSLVQECHLVANSGTAPAAPWQALTGTEGPGTGVDWVTVVTALVSADDTVVVTTLELVTLAISLWVFSTSPWSLAAGGGSVGTQRHDVPTRPVVGHQECSLFPPPHLDWSSCWR